ncbi:hypothetical protein [Petrimonas sulfuriphila]|uniref:hypothetical protein n=1 Tax=Petrimonas sulfuriphila TaxID=285070 RepID=UPI003EB6F080
MKLKNSGVIFRGADHTYWLNGKQLQGITGIISRQLFPNKYADIPEHVLNNAAKRGTEIHEACEAFDMFGISDRLETDWYDLLKKRENIEIIESEYLVTDGKDYASAIDKVGTVKGKNALLDIKTTYSLDLDSISWQLSIYKYFFNILNPEIEIEGLFAIWIRDGAKLVEVEEQPQEEVIRLLECDKNGVRYEAKPNVPDKYNEHALDLVRSLTDLSTQIKSLEEKKKEYQEKIEDLFNKFNVVKWETDYFTITKKADYTREGFDTKKFKVDYPDLAEEYKTTTQVKGSVSTILKNK